MDLWAFPARVSLGPGRSGTDNRQKVGKIETNGMARTLREAAWHTQRAASARCPGETLLAHARAGPACRLSPSCDRRQVDRTTARPTGIYREARLGLADDLQDANGETVLEFSQAQRAARTWWINKERLASGIGTRPSPIPSPARWPTTWRITGAAAARGPTIESVMRCNILPELGNLPVPKLTTRRLQDWHRRIAERPRHWRSRPGAEPKVAFDPKDAEAVRRRRATANRVLTYLKAALNHSWRAGGATTMPGAG